MRFSEIAIVDYQAGNLRSVQKALEHFGARTTITSDPRIIESSDGLVFPGQGANDSSMSALRRKNLIGPVRKFIDSGRPFLGICLGLQLLLEASDEGVEPGLGVLKGRVRRLPQTVTVPHMGWNQVTLLKEHPVLFGVPSNSYFYFVHSYYADPEDISMVAGITNYEIDFCSAVAWDLAIAVQFHPEKSGDIGLKLYRNFVDFVTES